MNKDVELVLIAKITGVHGLKGEVKAVAYGVLDDIHWDTVILAGKGRHEARRVVRARKHKGGWIIELEGCHDRSAAEALVGLEISVKKSELPETAEDEYYYFDLIGMEVYTDESRYIGRVTNVISTGGNDVLETTGPCGDVLIPAIESVIVSVDTGTRKITIRLIEGLLP
ncbi:MAG TPA: 16S rRNA processing protein RimM [Deltaproteobacteria bacterium]|nr:MAG: 16S rRNA processing protein RimM [Deltaproteobacteria bacterium GWA2_55_82]OGQ63235.1 MAG: 16S rRNA processing protein RimM [Deltaproteobacteria bacterium RIFCSPLOWO2_02_FULL_55_12]OIJ73070.1 MAG: 16S rRNA processing protein RimM [Deltaproteobacteria bacterium GWC2_55_46]HBG47831.1 16S rRNA processing protein RimM [Deltaproteobacteria bacterium]HCY11906.1 16S rRNA processing protein RimM [Deltaproteobacteria bacterium]